MIPTRVRISGTGIICALGSGKTQVIRALSKSRSGLGPLTRFKASHSPPFPVGEVPVAAGDPRLPQTIELARIASDQAMAGSDQAPDAVVLGVTTGGMAVTEELLKQGCHRPADYRYHGIGTVAQDLAHRFQCKGPMLTVSTACSSGGCAIALAAALIRSGNYERVLTGGVDSLCRLTYYGFKSLQLIDPEGARPLDRNRRGMSVAEGAGMLLLEAADEDFDGVEIMGAGLSCDAHHPAQPHPMGDGALAAMQAALSDAGMQIGQIDYINLHGTGTVDNDRSESTAVNRLFNNAPPSLSSLKGATGHSLAASGAIEAVIAAMSIDEGIIPANIGYRTADPALNVKPVVRSTRRSIDTVLSNSFGFGGNNAAVVIGRRSEKRLESHKRIPDSSPLTVIGWSAVTGAGLTQETIAHLSMGRKCQGRLDGHILCQGISPGVIRRIKRLSQMALALMTNISMPAGAQNPQSILFGTGWGSLSETHDFLEGLFESNEKFAGPTDFIGSVHNAAAGQMALLSQCKGANLTFSGGDYAFEQALMSAQLMSGANDPMLIVGADETHDKLSPLFDPSVARDTMLSDGGGALMLTREADPAAPTIKLTYFNNDFNDILDLTDLVTQLGGAGRICATYDMILVGLPAGQRVQCQKQLDQFVLLTGYEGEILDYRGLTGEYATSSAVAAVFAVSRLHAGSDRPKTAASDAEGSVLLLGLGSVVTAIEVEPP